MIVEVVVVVVVVVMVAVVLVVVVIHGGPKMTQLVFVRISSKLPKIC